VFLQLKQPDVFEVEPVISKEYQPDAYTRIGPDGTPTIIEYQRTKISKAKMEYKVREFVDTHKGNLHDAKTLLIVSDTPYDVTAPTGFNIVQRRLDTLV
jgi:hypothetical protein